jgi:predicted RNA-binding Zn ribbon-like protein
VPADTPALRLAVDFVNTHDALATPADSLTVAAARRLADRHGQRALATDLARADLDRLRELRANLYQVFAGPDRVAALDALVTADGNRVTLIADGALRLAVASGRADPVHRLAALLTDALAYAMVVGGPDRFGTCAAHPCRCGYLDRTRAGRQRYCCQLCNDRNAAAAYRARRR